MKTFLKVLLLAALLIVAIKLSPVIFFLAFVGLLAAFGLGVLGLSLVAVLAAVALALTVVLSPIWIPVLVVMGLIGLFKKSGKPSAPVTA